MQTYMHITLRTLQLPGGVFVCTFALHRCELLPTDKQYSIHVETQISIHLIERTHTPKRV